MLTDVNGVVWMPLPKKGRHYTGQEVPANRFVSLDGKQESRRITVRLIDRDIEFFPEDFLIRYSCSLGENWMGAFDER